MSSERACARAPGGISLVNALATGLGASLAIALYTRADVTLLDSAIIEVEIRSDGDEPHALARETARRVLDAHGLHDVGARIVTTSEIPVSRGLKSSSAAANAIALATDHAATLSTGKGGLAREELLDIGIDAAFAAGVTVTGAFDDACASMVGGIAVTDNRARAFLAHTRPPDGVRALILVPARKTRKTEAGAIDYASARVAATEAHERARAGAVFDAMNANGRAYGPLYGMDDALQRRVIDAGARAVSVSGTGPALAALVPDAHVDAVRAVLGEGDGDIIEAALTSRGAEVTPC